jgi:murein DD-endopeptidase MepM/ murein hydrolase activator NlpD
MFSMLTPLRGHSGVLITCIVAVLMPIEIGAQAPPQASPQISSKQAALQNDRKRSDCFAYPSQPASEYVLPWKPGTTQRVRRTSAHFQRNNGGVGLYALDIDMPTGTEIVAARAGEVVAVRDTYYDGNGKDLQENFVFIQHEDGTIGRYFRLTHRGVLVRVGTWVEQGQTIALSGNTGETATPHLHFDVQQCGPNLPPDFNKLPCGQTLPLTFRNARSHACGLVPGQTYRAEPWDGAPSEGPLVIGAQTAARP